MSRHVLSPLILSGLLSSCAAPEENTVASVDGELTELVEMLTGKYAGDAPKAMIPGSEMQRLVHSFEPITAPQLGEQVVYYHVTRDSVEGPILQAKIFIFATDAERTSNTMRALVLNPEQAETMRKSDAAEWRSLSRDGLMSFPEVCFFTWVRQEDGFLGEGSDQCSYESAAFGQTITPDMHYRITGDVFELEETLVGEDGEAIVTTGGPLLAVRQ